MTHFERDAILIRRLALDIEVLVRQDDGACRPKHYKAYLKAVTEIKKTALRISHDAGVVIKNIQPLVVVKDPTK